MRDEIPLELAFANALRNRESCRWPSGGNQRRLEPAYKPILRPRFSLKPGAKVFTIGSCFARHIEEHLAQSGFDVPMLSLAVPPEEYRPAVSIADKFTPLSALQEIERTLSMVQSPERTDQIIEDVLFPIPDGKFIDLELREYVPVARERAYERRRDIFKIFTHAFDADCVIITLGLVECWMDHKTGRAIQETPHALALRRAKDRFALRILDITEVLQATDRMIRLLLSHGRPDVKILMTVSPVPLEATFSAMDVVIANAYSKSVLRVAAQMLYDRFEQVDYFPSYEMVTMSRGPDVWEPDLVHVDRRFVGKVVDVLVQNYVRSAPVVPDTHEVLPLKTRFDARPPCGWLATVNELADHCDTDGASRTSSLLLYEDDIELGPAHELHERIIKLGGGAYSFWKGTLYFSTSDGSDPNANGRNYTVRRTVAG
ncbi:MAG: GSCFA domain-containing protein [Reyranella sp.]|uniref:GSCFA domain-containing protein n=1 Tax=Reyranella sp. TaxID=1929291 RepID=UPI00272F982C|nr:GSCFA domain-containing protein [Reyranella sp.]MDP1965601.1 GSCFA domain-containing protein [Reyranella sp.]MDP2377504.1 GSCFA domain-containing protein [Reyranella sp.]